MANPFPSGEGETRTLADAQGPNKGGLYDRAAVARKYSRLTDTDIINQPNQDGAVHLQRSIHDLKDMGPAYGVVARGDQDGNVDLKRSI